MKWFAILFSLFSFQLQSCELTTSQSEQETKRFDQAMAQAEHVIVGEVMRLYKLPSWEKGVQGIVIQTIADLKGYASDYVDAALLPVAGISPTPEQNGNYWPSEIETTYLFAIKKEQNEFFVTAIANAQDEHLFRSCLKMRRERAELRQKKLDEEDFTLPPHLRVDHTADFDE